MHIANAANTVWNHEGRDYWPEQFAGQLSFHLIQYILLNIGILWCFSACSGKRQSPINIDVYDAKVESAVQDLKFARYIKTHRLSFSKIDMYFLINPNFGNTFIFYFLNSGYFFCQKTVIWATSNKVLTLTTKMLT